MEVQSTPTFHVVGLPNNCFGQIADHLIVHVTEFVNVQSVVALQRTCVRFHKILTTPSFLSMYITMQLEQQRQQQSATSFCSSTSSSSSRSRSSTAADAVMSDKEGESNTRTRITTLEQLALSQETNRLGLERENRIGFDMASTAMDDSVELIPGCPLTRLQKVGTLLKQFERATVVIDAHCGTVAPRGIAAQFSRLRGVAICERLEDEEVFVQQQQEQEQQEHHQQQQRGNNNKNNNAAIWQLEDRMEMNAWGKTISTLVSNSQHKYADYAQLGRDWVELYLKLDNVEFPERPSCYKGRYIVDVSPWE